MISEVELKKMYWHSRRGMLELDLILVPFAEGRLGGLAEREQLLYRELLREEDQDLFAWLVHRRPAPEAHREIIGVVLDRQEFPASS